MSSPESRAQEVATLGEGYREYLARLQMTGIFLEHLRVDLDREAVPAPRSETEVRVSVKHDVELESRESEILMAEVAYVLKVKQAGVRKAFCTVHVTFSVVFSGAEAPPAEYVDHLNANVVFITWPYLREITGSIAVRSAVPIPVAPLMIA